MSHDYDLRSHAVFEASAGTGKTKKIEQLVLRILTETDTTIDQLLIVTYTDKAAAELKERLRSALETAWVDTAAEKEKIACALEAFDRAQVSTIHSFCLRVLRQFPFDHGLSTRAQMVRDIDVLESCLHRVERTEWPAQYRDQLAPLLELSGYVDAHSGGSNWEALVISIANGYRPACQHELRPVIAADCAALLAGAQAPFAANIKRLRARCDPLLPLDGNPLWLNFGQHAATRKDSRDAVGRNILAPVLSWLGSAQTTENPVGSFGLLLKQLQPVNFARLTDILKPPLTDACAALPEIVATLQQMQGDLAGLQYKLAVDTVQSVIQQMHAYKLERGLQSFDDFLTRVALALDSAHNPRAPELLTALRHTYRYAIVDEFQDTDPIQWQIFRRIFVDAADQQHFLIVVGDPKQAIYAFRNADIEAYLAACEEILKRTSHAPRTLATNYRTCRDLLAPLNRLFEHGKLFSGPIGYAPVAAAKPQQSTEIVPPDVSNRPALTLLRIETGRTAMISQRVASFIAAEIDRLLHGNKGGPALTFKRRGTQRTLSASDIAVLMFRRHDAVAVEDELRRRGIPYSFYKKSGVWQSDEAVHLLYVLLALSRPDNPAAFRKMLLTRFFRIPPEQAAAYDECGQNHPLRVLFLNWQQLAEQRNWAELFRSLLEDTGALRHESAEFDGSRRLANHRYIMSTLAHEACSKGAALLDVVDSLKQKRRTLTEDETGLQPADTDRPTVKLMTIHASKGLEFPIVFLTGGYSAARGKPYLKYHDGGKLVFDLQKDDTAAKARAQQEERDENTRLLYVALTRAMLKLYLPYVSVPRASGILPKLLTPALDLAKPHEDTATCGVVKLDAMPPETPTELRPQHDNPMAADKVALPEALCSSVSLPALALRRTDIRSFTGIVLHESQLITDENLFGEAQRHDDDSATEPRIPDPLPSGAATGDAMHQILERIGFDHVLAAKSAAGLLRTPATATIIESALRRHLPLVFTAPEQARIVLERTAEIIWNTLHTPLAALGGMKLGALPNADRLHELDFDLPFAGDAERDRYLTGCMDLLFRANGRYFLLDWKSNTLPTYGAAALQAEMDARQYTLQYRIYLNAVKCWLERQKRGFSPQRDFGGVIYVFLRGISPVRPDDGIFIHQPTGAEWNDAALQNEIQKQLRRRRAVL